MAEEEADSPFSDLQSEGESMNAILRALGPLDPVARQRVLSAVMVLMGVSFPSQPARYSPLPSQAVESSPVSSGFSSDRTPSPKEFLFQKRPQTDVDRVACLAYYLTHYRETPHFKTLDLSKLNTEAAQLKLSNPAMAVDNASKAGLLVQAIKGAKQLSAVGELYVQALPDKGAAREAIAHARPKRKPRRIGKSASSPEGDVSEEE